MALTPTNQIELGFSAPDFFLIDVCTSEHKSYADIKGAEGTVVMFICNSCTRRAGSAGQ